MTSSHFISSIKRLLHASQAIALLAGGGLAVSAVPQQKIQVPGYYRMMVGQFEVTALYDGAIGVDTKLLKNTGEEEVGRLLSHLFVKGPVVQTAVNAYLINTGNKLVLIDAGVGASQIFGPALGRIGTNLVAGGYHPDQIDAVFLTHLHPDHVTGLLTADGKAVFPHAEIWSSQDDNDFWLNEGVASKAPAGFQPFFKMAREAAAPYQATGRWKTFSHDEEILPGVTSISAYGHTPGHSAYLLSSGDQRLLIWGDIVHNHAVQFDRPEVAIEFDSNKDQAVAARKKLFAKAAKERLLVGGMHLPFPGLGHVRADGSHYAWVPVEFAPAVK